MIRLFIALALLSLPIQIMQQVVGTMAAPTGGGSAPTASVLGCVNSPANAASITCTVFSNTTGLAATAPTGSTIWCAVNNFTSGLTYTITDSASDIYTSEYAQFSFSIGSTSFFQTFYTLAATSGVTTVTLSNVAATTMTFPSITCLTATGVTARDVTPYVTPANMHHGATGTTLSVGPFTTTGSDWIPCVGYGTGGTTLSKAASFSYGINSQVSPWVTFTGSNTVGQYFVQSSAGAITPTITASTSVAVEGMCGAFL
jgi:hypothetical protein